MNVDAMQGYAPAAAAGVVALLIVVALLVVVRRRRAASAQAAAQSAHAEAVTAYRTHVEQLLARREELLSGITAIESGHIDESLQERVIDTTDPVARLELDVLLSGDNQEQRTSSLRALRRGVSDIEMLLPEPPLPPAPVARLSRRARHRAERWRQERAAELDALRGLARPAAAPAGHVPAQAAGPRDLAEVHGDAVA